MKKPFAPIRREFLEHAPGLAPVPFKVYICLHLLADHRNGQVRATIAELAERCGLTKSTLARALKHLEQYYIQRPKSGIIAIERYGEIPTGGKSDGEDEAEEIPTRGKSGHTKIPTSGTEIPTGGKKNPTGGNPLLISDEKEEKEDSLLNGSREGVQGKRESPDSGEPQEPPSPWAPWADAEALRDAILERYPAGGVDKAGARVLWQALIGLDQHRAEPRAPGIGKRMFAAASLIAERCPAERFAYLPSARKFFDGRWEDDWAEILKRWQAEVERAKKPRGDAEPEYRIERRRTGLR